MVRQPDGVPLDQPDDLALVQTPAADLHFRALVITMPIWSPASMMACKGTDGRRIFLLLTTESVAQPARLSVKAT